MNLTEVPEFTKLFFAHADRDRVTQEGLHMLTTTVKNFILILLLS